MRILITGGAGFIGSHLSEALLEKGDRVDVVDDLSTGSLKNLEHLLRNENFTFNELDVVNGCPSLHEYDVIFHLAALANPTDYMQRPLDTLLVSSIGTWNLLKNTDRNDIKFIYFSSSEVYGNKDTLPEKGIKEDDVLNISSLTDRSPYIIGKLYGEEITRLICQERMIDHIIIRPFNIYGTRMDVKSSYGRVIPNFFRMARDDIPLRVHGDGEQQRSFCHIEDLIRGLLMILEKDVLGGRVLNIGSPEPL